MLFVLVFISTVIIIFVSFSSNYIKNPNIEKELGFASVKKIGDCLNLTLFSENQKSFIFEIYGNKNLIDTFNFSVQGNKSIVRCLNVSSSDFIEIRFYEKDKPLDSLGSFKRPHYLTLKSD
ncbi:MAG: hypothetical protein QXJ62_00650 [Nitrososphaeria archaeon]